jgi:hypothetical protein
LPPAADEVVADMRGRSFIDDARRTSWRFDRAAPRICARQSALPAFDDLAQRSRLRKSIVLRA